MRWLISLMLMLHVGAVEATAESSVHLRFRDGRIWLDARETTVAAVLAEWSRHGGVTIVAGEALTAEVKSLQFEGIEEGEAVSILLRNAAGYILVQKNHASSEASTIDKIVVIPSTSNGSRAPAAATIAVEEDTVPAYLTGPLGDALRAEIARRNASATARSGSKPDTSTAAPSTDDGQEQNGGVRNR